MFNVVLVEPEIPSNTGNIGRTCVITGSRLHLVGPYGFTFDYYPLKRAGMAYWSSLDVRYYSNWEDFLAKCGIDLEQQDSLAAPHLHLLTKRGKTIYSDATYSDGDWLVFGKESAGLSRQLIDSHPRLCERIPMLDDDHALTNAKDWQEQYGELHPELRRDVAGNFVDDRVNQVTSLNLSNAAAIVLYEALRQTGFKGLEA